MKTLEAKKRDLALSTDFLRKEGKVPAIVYGKGTENIAVIVMENEVRKIWRDVRGTETFTLDVEGQSFPVIMKDIQAHVVSGEILSIDFHIQK